MKKNSFGEILKTAIIISALNSLFVDKSKSSKKLNQREIEKILCMKEQGFIK